MRQVVCKAGGTAAVGTWTSVDLSGVELFLGDFIGDVALPGTRVFLGSAVAGRPWGDDVRHRAA